jgi:hypothetical protein
VCVDDDQVQDRALEVASQLATGAQQAIRWTKQTLNHWYRQQAAILDASLAYEMLASPDPTPERGWASHTDKRTPASAGRPSSRRRRWWDRLDPSRSSTATVSRWAARRPPAAGGRARRRGLPEERLDVLAELAAAVGRQRLAEGRLGCLGVPSRRWMSPR